MEHTPQVGQIARYHPKLGQIRISRFVLNGTKRIVIGQSLLTPQTVDHTWFTTLTTHHIVDTDIEVLTKYENLYNG